MSLNTLRLPLSPPDQQLWQGRRTSPDAGPLYWYQQVQFPTGAEDLKATGDIPSRVGFIGYASDLGVTRNQGRAGAAAGPDAIRRQLGKLPFTGATPPITDLGNVRNHFGSVEESQFALANVVETWHQTRALSVVLGGGHDLAFGHFLGIHRALKPGARLAVINVDAHLDLRSASEGAHSGTSFSQIRQVLAGENKPLHYCAIGIDPLSNTRDLFQTAQEAGALVIPREDCQWSRLYEIRAQVRGFLHDMDAVYLSIDLDAFSMACSPGVSAPAAIGIQPDFVVGLLTDLMQTGKVVGLDVAEMNPAYDRDDQSARLAAQLIGHALHQIPANHN